MTLPLFSAFGIELEYMIVKRNSLDVAAVADKLIEKVAGKITNDVDNGNIAWSNELVSFGAARRSPTPDGHASMDEPISRNGTVVP